MKDTSTDNARNIREARVAGSSIIIKKGGTTYVVGLHFNKSSKETMVEKIKRMLRNEVTKS